MARNDGRRADRRDTSRRSARSRSSTRGAAARTRSTTGPTRAARSARPESDVLLDTGEIGAVVDDDLDDETADGRIAADGANGVADADADDRRDRAPADNVTHTDHATHAAVRARVDAGRSSVQTLARGLDQMDINWVLALTLAACLAVVALTLAPSVRNYMTNRAEFEQITSSNQQLRDEISDYQKKVEQQNDPAYVEAQARERLHYVNPGEKAVVMMYPGDEARKAAQAREAERARNAWYGNLWDAVSTPPAK